MAEFRLSERADRDLIDIYDYTEATFGVYQAEAYQAGLDGNLLSHFPRIGRIMHDLAPGFRRFQFQAHVIFYTEEPDFVVIRAVLHHSREIKPDLFE